MRCGQRVRWAKGSTSLRKNWTALSAYISIGMYDNMGVCNNYESEERYQYSIIKLHLKKAQIRRIHFTISQGAFLLPKKTCKVAKESVQDLGAPDCIDLLTVIQERLLLNFNCFKCLSTSRCDWSNTHSCSSPP